MYDATSLRKLISEYRRLRTLGGGTIAPQARRSLFNSSSPIC
jgi:hypothetical protein